jgi:type VI protein secretion system component VasK
VLLGRLTALLRALVPSMSGMARMRYRTFVAWNALGGMLWAGACVWLGYAFAASLHKIERYATWAPVPVVVAVVGAWLALDIRRKRRDRAEATQQSETAQPAEATEPARPVQSERTQSERTQREQAKGEPEHHELPAAALEVEQAG